MKMILTVLLTLFTTMSFAHDEGHGPKASETDVPKQGGTLASVVKLSEAKKGASAELQYKSEFVRSEDGTVRVFVYDKSLAPVDMSKFAKDAKGMIEVMKKGKIAKKLPFSLKLEDGAFVGKAPKSPSKPYNLYVILKSDGLDLLSELSNVD
jgi:hypothetical protein